MEKRLLSLVLLSVLVSCIIAVIYATDVETSDFTIKERVPYISFARLGNTLNLWYGTQGVDIINKDIITRKFTVENYTSTHTQYSDVSNSDDRKNSLDISGTLALNIKQGPASLTASGLGGYIQSQGSSNASTEILFTATVRTRYEYLSRVETLMDEDSCTRAASANATHVITGILYGGQCIVSCKIFASSAEELEQTKAQVMGQLTVAEFDVNANASLDLDNSASSANNNVAISVYCNANLMKVSTNASEVISTVKSSLGIMHSQNPNGVPIKMDITPIQVLTCPTEGNDEPVGLDSLGEYYSAFNAMLDDTKAASEKIYHCMQVYPFLTQYYKNETTDIRNTHSLIKSINNKLTSMMRTTSGKSIIDHFDEIEWQYTGTENADVKIAPWNYQYWAVPAFNTCKTLKYLNMIAPTKRFAAITSTLLLCRNSGTDLFDEPIISQTEFYAMSITNTTPVCFATPL